MSSNAKDDRIKEIERELAEKRGLLETLNKSIESMRDDPDMIADIGAHTGGRKRRTEEEIKQLEEELRSLQGKSN